MSDSIMILKVLAVLLVLKAFGGSASAGTPPVEELGVRGDYESEFAKVLENSSLLVIKHPAIAQLWGQKFLFPHGFDGGEVHRRVIPLSSGPYSDSRPVVFVLIPKLLADQAGFKRSIRGISIESLTYEAEKSRLTAQVLLCAEGKTYSCGTLSFPCTPEEFGRVLLLNKALRLRIRLTMTIKTVEGRQRDGGTFLDLTVANPEVDVLDIQTPLFSRKQDVGYVPTSETLSSQLLKQSAVQQEESPEDKALKDLLVTMDTWAGPIGDAALTNRMIRLIFDADELDGLPYSEGLQPYRRGWFLKDAFPKQQAGIIAVCSHMQLPASVTKTLPTPLPPGLYKVAFRTTYYRSRFFDNILRIKLGNTEVETCYWFPGYSFEGGPSDWVYAPALRTTVSADRLTITVLQVGGGDRGQAPPYFRRWIAFDRFFITNVMDDIDGDHLAGQNVQKTENK